MTETPCIDHLWSVKKQLTTYSILRSIQHSLGENEAKRRAEQGDDQQTKAVTGYKQNNIKDSKNTHLATSQELNIWKA